MTQEQIDQIKMILLLFLSGLPPEATVEQVIWSLNNSHVTAEEVNEFIGLVHRPAAGNA